MRRDRISGYALGIVVIVGVVTFTFLRLSANSKGEIMVQASILLSPWRSQNESIQHTPLIGAADALPRPLLKYLRAHSQAPTKAND